MSQPYSTIEGCIMLLLANHSFFTTSTDMLELAAPLRKLGITYFTYSRFYHTGERLYLSTHRDVLENYLEKQYYLIGNTEGTPQSYIAQTVMWSMLPNQKVFEDTKVQFNIGNGIFIFQPQATYCECYGLAGDRNNEKLINVYLTHLDFLKSFILNFNEKAESLIHKTSQNKIILPYNKVVGNFLNNDNEIIDRQVFNLTERQKQCAYLLLQGKTTKEIAKQLYLSPRTIESYINNLKSKLMSTNKTTLILKLSELLE